eukprot:SAG22_NODE_13972_length_389_cov_0.724138_1_plen_77_part_10
MYALHHPTSHRPHTMAWVGDQGVRAQPDERTQSNTKGTISFSQLRGDRTTQTFVNMGATDDKSDSTIMKTSQTAQSC